MQKYFISYAFSGGFGRGFYLVSEDKYERDEDMIQAMEAELEKNKPNYGNCTILYYKKVD